MNDCDIITGIDDVKKTDHAGRFLAIRYIRWRKTGDKNIVLGLARKNYIEGKEAVFGKSRAVLPLWAIERLNILLPEILKYIKQKETQ